jgi:hypothetical protein
MNIEALSRLITSEIEPQLVDKNRQQPLSMFEKDISDPHSLSTSIGNFYLISFFRYLQNRIFREWQDSVEPLLQSTRLEYRISHQCNSELDCKILVLIIVSFDSISDTYRFVGQPCKHIRCFCI